MNAAAAHGRSNELLDGIKFIQRHLWRGRTARRMGIARCQKRELLVARSVDGRVLEGE